MLTVKAIDIVAVYFCSMGLLTNIFNLFSRKQEPVFNADELTEQEKELCSDAGLSEADGLFLKQVTKQPIEPFEFESEYSETEKPTGISSLIAKDVARDVISNNRERLAKEGKTIFISEFAGDVINYIISIVPIADPYQIMEYAETNGANHDIETTDIISKYKEWDERFGILPIAIGFDFCECEIINKDIDYTELANEVYGFCPDVVEQGTETVEALAAEMKENGTIFLWWD
jgi:hypothetical protein